MEDEGPDLANSGLEDEDEMFFTMIDSGKVPQLIDGQHPSGGAGYLWKRGKGNKDFQLRYFKIENVSDVLKGARITYYVDESCRKRQGSIELSEIESMDVPLYPEGEVYERSGVGFVFCLQSRNQGRRWVLKATSRAIRDRWAQRLSYFVGVSFVPSEPSSIQVIRDSSPLDWTEACVRKDALYVEAKVRTLAVSVDSRGKPFSQYVVSVRTNAGFIFKHQSCFTINHRYSEFVELQRSLLPFAPPKRAGLPYIPPRNYSDRFSGGILEERRQCFEALLQYWIDLSPAPMAMPLALRKFLEPEGNFDLSSVLDVLPASFVASTNPSPTASHASVRVGVRSLPPILQFQSSSYAFEDRMRSLNTWLQAHEKEEITCVFARQLVESVGGLAMMNRVEVINRLIPLVVDRERLFLVLELIPTTLLPDVLCKM